MSEKESVKQIFMIEVLPAGSHLWVPMYQPCYSLDEAKMKLKRQKYTACRIGRYIPDPYWDSKAYTNQE